ncbi:MAG: hypothetical protein LIP12_11500 [Clostridiales bacterium]|nr:hypothetical protein [Clostridiales bacterium]
MKKFNTAVVCNPKKHYMVDLTERVERIIKNYVEPGNYFAINRGRQYGKTTTLCLLAEKLREKYICVQISFEGNEEMFQSDYTFVSGVMDLIEEQLEFESVPEHLIEKWKNEIDTDLPFQTLAKRITELCRFSERPIVLMIDEVLSLAKMFDYIKSVNGRVAVSNRIFEVVLYDYFLSEDETGNITKKDAELNKRQFIVDGRLDMEALLRKFAEHYAYVYADNDQKFIEKYARKIFLMYLKPVINGTGNYYIEAQTRDEKKTDIIVDYHAEQFLIETKIWYGQKYNEEGEKQLYGYLDRLKIKKGYMLTFSFNKNKKTGVQERRYGEKILWEITV